MNFITNNINPTLFTFGPFSIRWYGLFLAIGVGVSVWIIYNLFKQKKYSVDLVLDLSAWLIIGGLVGARLGEILFYEPMYYFSHPLEMIMINHGGLSSHGMTIGLLATLLIFSKVKKISLANYLDILVIPIPLLAMLIRIGNFFNSEIVGKATNLPWAVIFQTYDHVPRHPVQLYEAIICFPLFFVLYFLFKKYSSKTPSLFFFHLFLLLYFSSRFLIEFTKEYQTSWEGILTAGQILSLPFILYSTYWFLKNKKTPIF